MPTNEPTVTDEPELAPRQCGRCQGLFPGDPDKPVNAMANWWACDPCRGSLFAAESKG